MAAEKRPLSDTNRFVGRVEAIERVDVRARISGFLEKILFKDGDWLKAGAPLYQIEKGPFEAAIQQAQAAVLKARAQLDNAKLQKQRADELIKTNAISQATHDELGAENSDTATCLNNLAALVHLQGDYAAAEPLFRRALEISEKALGPEHPDTGTSLYNLARLLQAKGDYDEAEPLYRRALATNEKATA